MGIGLWLTTIGAAGTAGKPPVDQVFGRPGDGGIITVRPALQQDSLQGLGRFEGISGRNSGAKGLSLNRIVIPPGGRAKAHRHVGYETAIYLVSGRVETRYGPDLKRSMINRTGDFIFIPADVVHMPINLSDTEPAIAIVARNDPNEQESVELHDKHP
jgi:uncharacterized RmlC-like cupin family protein